jgi:glyoxylase-like metal-dependent hydrolase (beta-lactamase superfamily II)
MAWSTSIVAPPDGSMRAYMDSLDKLRGRAETTYWPGHGGPVVDPQRYLRALIHHRRQREASILNALADGPQTIPALVARIYVGLNPSLTRPFDARSPRRFERARPRGRRNERGWRAQLPSCLRWKARYALFPRHSRAARSVTVAGRNLFADVLEDLVIVAKLNCRHAIRIASV